LRPCSIVASTAQLCADEWRRTYRSENPAGGVYLADGRECKLLSGIDDHSRYVVIATVLAVPSGQAVADAFVQAMRCHGVPAEVLTDNGKQFTGRFTRPRRAEVLFERVCREHGITAKLTNDVVRSYPITDEA
jgi:transposase InsO family protein